MSLVWASGLLVVALPFMLWPLFRPREECVTTGRDTAREQEERRGAVLLAIEEVELDEASGRLEAGEARNRLAELRSEAERILRGR